MDDDSSITGLRLAEDGNTQYRIVLSSECSHSERHAATELAYFLEKISGARLLLHQDNLPPGDAEIAVGAGNRTRGVVTDSELAALGPDGFIIRTVGKRLLIAGGRQRGTMYGVYTFLEDCLGCRWYSARFSVIPQLKEVCIPALDRTSIPAFAIRDPFYFDAFDADWSARNKCNGLKSDSSRLQGCRADEQRGGPTRMAMFYHSFQRLVPPSKYFETHPEYFSLIDGKRVGATHGSQLCLTNADVLRIVIEEVERIAERDPTALIPVAQNDGFGSCECASCKALDEKEGSPSGTLLHFLNQVAERVCSKYPEVTLATEAYVYTRKAPRHVKPHPNVLMTFASYLICYAHGEDCPINRETYADLRAWTNICKRIHVWDYSTNFTQYLIPHANLYQMPHFIRALADVGVMGVTEQGSYQCPNGEFADLRAWLFSKLMWDPEIDYETALMDFLNGYYGAAGPIIREYIEITHAPYMSEPHQHLRMDGEALPFGREYYTRAHALFDQAEETAAADEELLWRVQVARAPLEHMTLRVMPEAEAQRKARIARFFRSAGLGEIRRCSEGEPLETLRREFAENVPSANAITEYHLLGPFESTRNGSAGFDLVHPPEEAVDLSGTYSGQGGRSIRWQQVSGALLGLVDLSGCVGPASNAVAYAWTALDLPRDLRAKLAIACTGGIAVWHNREKVLCVDRAEGFEVNRHAVELHLVPGRNELLFKVAQKLLLGTGHKHGRWDFMAWFDRDVRAES